MFEILFLGTAAAVPSRDRSMPCTALRHGPSIALFDCGEGTQRQLMVSPFSFMKVDWIFLTHMHGDHLLGLPGLLQTMSLSGRTKPLTVAGPPGIGQSLEWMLSACEGAVEYEVTVLELGFGDVVACEGFSVEAFETCHVVDSVGYVITGEDRRGTFDKEKAIALGLSDSGEFSRVIEGETVKGVKPDDVMGPSKPGLKIVYTGDTSPTEKVIEASRDADLLIHEATFMEPERHIADARGHSTALAAAETAKKAGVRNLILTHISNRYDDTSLLVEEASEEFPGTLVAKDMDLYRLTTKGLRSV